MSAPTMVRGQPAMRPPIPEAPPPGPSSTSLTAASCLIGALALLSGTSALSATVSGSGWVAPVVEVVAVVWLIGVGARMIKVPTAFVVLLQVIALVVALTSLFTSSGIGGAIPDVGAVREGGQLLSGAWTQILRTVPPAPSTPELAFLMAIAVGVAELMVDFLIAEAKAPALVALPLLCLYSVPASISNHILPWYAFVAPAILYALLLAVAEHPGRRTGMRAGVGMASNGLVVAAIAAVASLVIADSVTSVGTTGRLPHTNSAGTQVGLSPFASLHGSLSQSAAVNLISVTGLAEPDYLRTVALNVWTAGQGFSLGALSADANDIDGLLPGASVPNGPTVTVTSARYRDRFLPLLQTTSEVSGLSPGWSFDAALDSVFRTGSVNPGTYQMTINSTKPTSAELEADTVTPGGVLTDTGSALPASVAQMALDVTSNAQTPFDKAEALEQWFTPANGFSYSLDVPTGNSGDALVDFLTNRKGFCEQYAAAMAIMLRSLNIPARVAIGFTQGAKQADGSYLITSHDAHAWVEVAFDQAGWVRFDPTPVVDGQGGQNGFSGGSAANPTPTSTAGNTATQTVKPSAQKPDGGLTSISRPPALVPQNLADAGSGNTGGLSQLGLLLIAVAVIALAVLLAAPGLIRRGRRRARLKAASRGGPEAALAAWSEVEDTAIDHGFLPHPAESARVAANRIARLARLNPEQRSELRGVVLAAEQSWYATDGDEPPSTGSNGARPATGLPSGPGPMEHDVPKTSWVAVGLAVDDRPQTNLVVGVRAVLDGFGALPKLPLPQRLLPRSLQRRNR